MTHQGLLVQLENQRNIASDGALDSIEKLRKHLEELEKGVRAWTIGEAGPQPMPYGNAFGDVQCRVAQFHDSAKALAYAEEVEVAK